MGLFGFGLPHYAGCGKWYCMKTSASIVHKDYPDVLDLLCCKKYPVLMSQEV